jgi:hypothetical protein
MSKKIVMAGWDHAPHLGEAEKAEMLVACEPHLRRARSEGVPSLGSGAVYPIMEEEITVEPIQIMPWHYKVYGMDVGWNYTAVVWGAWDKESDVVYLYDCYKREKAEPEIHAAAVKLRNVAGTDIPGVIDPASRGRGQADGQQLLQLYRRNGLKLITADNAVESGIYNVWSRLSTGRLKIVKGPMTQWLEEYRMYRRDEKGKVVKIHDHLMDATRYLMMSGLRISKRLNPQRTLNAQSRNYGV